MRMAMHVGQGVHHQAKIMSFTVVLMMPARGRWVQAEREAGSRLNFDYAPSPCQEVACKVAAWVMPCQEISERFRASVSVKCRELRRQAERKRREGARNQ
jgi:hypothetical protein